MHNEIVVNVSSGETRVALLERSVFCELHIERVTSKSVVGKKITGVRSALDNAVDEAFKGIDWDQLQKDWIAFSK